MNKDAHRFWRRLLTADYADYADFLFLSSASFVSSAVALFGASLVTAQATEPWNFGCALLFASYFQAMPVFYDTHAHLSRPEFVADLPEVMARALEAGITKIVTIGTDLASSVESVKLAEEYPNVFAVVGWHPSHALEAPSDLRPALHELARHPKVVALGETGLDYYRLPSQKGGATPADITHYKTRQAELFQQHLEVAAELKLNCVIHQRSALEDTLAQLQPFASRVRGVFHCFADDAAAMQRILALGSLVSFTGILTFKNGQNIRDALAATPLDQFMLETDCPFLAPMPYRGKRCEPAYVRETSEVTAQVKGCSLEALSAATCATAEKFFGKLAVTA
jgi:TatD DNase family protein